MTKPPKHKPLSANERSRARNRRAARILGGITLDAEQDAKLTRITRAQRVTAADWVRRKIEAEPVASGRPTRNP